MLADHNIETAKALVPGPIDLMALFSTSEAIAAARELFEPHVHPDFETVHDPIAIPMGIGTPTAGGVSKGIDGFITLWADYLSAWETWVVTPIEYVAVDDDRVLVLMTYGGRSKTHGVEMNLEGGNLMTMRDAKLARLELFFKRKTALKAAGLA